MTKTKLFLDFDSTLVDSISAYINTYNQFYRHYPNFKVATINVRQYNLKDQCPLIENVNDIFGNQVFF